MSSTVASAGATGSDGTPPGPLSGKAAIVTGAATGIGKAIAARLARDGAAIVVNHLNQPELAAALVRDIESTGGRAIQHSANISSKEQYTELFRAAIERFGQVDVLVNNAAVATIKPIAEVTEDDLDLILAVNVKGTLYGCQLAVAHLRDGGRIINISSATTGLMLPGYGIYDMTKGAVEQLTRILCKELGPRGITVNAVSPGATETETYRTGKDPAFLESLERLSSFNRLGQPEEIAAAVAFLAGNDGRWITGQNIRVNGGTV